MPFRFDTEEEQETRKSQRYAPTAARAADSDTEIALGTRSLLAIFFGLVLICSVFFGLGYSVGRAGGSRAAQSSPDLASVPESHLPKPSPEQLTPVQPPSATTDEDHGAPTTPEGTPEPQPTRATAAPPASAPAPVNSSPVPATAPVTSPASKPATFQPAAATMATAFMVQVAAVRVPQDAQILVDALKKHGYTAMVRNEPQDQLLHIQLGPYTSRADAIAMRSKLLTDGYNAVVK
jgi:cell division protein FtsN